MVTTKSKKPLANKSKRFAKPEPGKIYPRLDLHGVYSRQCKALGIKMNTTIAKMIPKGEDSYKQLSELDVSNNYLGDVGVRALLEVIRLSSNLQTVGLNNSGVSDSTIILMCAVLVDHPTIVSVDLSDNKITQESVSLIKSLLRNNKKISFFNTAGNKNIYESGRRDVELLAATNLGLKQGTSFVEAIQRQILAKFCEPKPNLLWRKQDLKIWIGERLIKSIPTPNTDGWVTISLFISATFSDFHTELHVINNIIVPELNSMLRKFKIHLLPIDLHQSRAYNCDSIENIQNVKYCLGTLRRSSDIFIGLHGHNLGWVPSLDEIPSYDIYKDVRNTALESPSSITYLQFKEAMKWSATDVKIGFQYFRHANVISDIPEALKELYLEKTSRRFILASEKKKIREAVPSALTYDGYGAHFKSVDRHGQIHLCRYSDFEETVQSDIFNALELMYPGVLCRSKLLSPPEINLNAYSDNVDQYFSFTNGNYINVDEFLSQGRDALQPNTSDVHDSRIVIFYGQRGCGLTSTIWALGKFENEPTDSPKKQNVYYLQYFVSLHSLTNSSTDVRSIFKNLYLQSLTVMKSEGHSLPESDSTLTAIQKGKLASVRTYFWNHLSSVAKKLNKGLIVLLDDIHKATGDEDPIHCLLGKRSDLPAAVRIGLSVSTDQTTLIERLQNIDPKCKLVAIPKLNTRNKKKLFNSFLIPYAMELTDEVLPLAINKKCSELPLYLKLLANECLHCSRHISLPKLLATSVDCMSEVISEMFSRREAKESVAGAKLYLCRLISILCVSRIGLTDQEARELLMKEYKEINREEDYRRGTGCNNDGYQSCENASEKHNKETIEIRRRLWGRWANYNPRLLPGSIWSRLIFELRPFTQRKINQTRTSAQLRNHNTNTYALSWSSQAVAQVAQSRYLSSSKRVARFHAQLANFYRGKSYLPNNVLWRTGLRETVYHMSKAWMWDTLIDILRPSLLYYCTKEKLLCELLRDLEAAEEEMERCVEAHKLNIAMQNKLLAKLPHMREYRSVIRSYGDIGWERPSRILACMLMASPETRIAKQIRELYHTQGISYMVPPIPSQGNASAVTTFYDNRSGVPFSGFDHIALMDVQICVFGDCVFTWITPPSQSTKALQKDDRKYAKPATIYIWSSETTSFIRELTYKRYSDSHVVSCAISKDGLQLVAGSSCYKAFLFDIESGDLLSTLSLPPRGTSNLVGFMFLREEPQRPDGQLPPKQICCWDDVGRFLVWNSSDEGCHHINSDISIDSDPITSVASSPASAKVVMTHERSTTSVLYCLAIPSTPIKVSSLTARESPKRVYFVEDTSTHVLTITDRRIILWFADTAEQLIQIEMNTSLTDLVSINYHPHSQSLVIVDLGKQVCCWSVVHDTGCVTIKEQYSIPVEKEWMLDYGESSWISSSEFVVGTSRSSGDIKMCCLSPDVRGPSHTQAIIPSEAINMRTAAGVGRIASLITFSRIVAHPTISNRFYLSDSSSGVPFVIDINKLNNQCAALSLTVLD